MANTPKSPVVPQMIEDETPAMFHPIRVDLLRQAAAEADTAPEPMDESASEASESSEPQPIDALEVSVSHA